MIYLIVIFTLLLLSFIYDINGVQSKRDFWYRFMLLVFILLSGLRWRLGVDTTGYLFDFYHECPTLNRFSFDDYSLFSNPLFVLLNSVVLTLGGKFYIVQLIHASFVNILIFKYIKKHTQFIFVCLFFYAIIAYSKYNMEIMKGSMSIVICLYANDYILEKKWVKGYILYFIALLFHGQTILLFFLPLLFTLKLNIKGLLVLACAFMVGRIAMNLLGDYFFLFEVADDLGDKANTYMNSDKYSGQSGNVNFFIQKAVLDFVYPVLSLVYAKNKATNTEIIKLEPFVMISLFFVMIRASVEIAYRYVDYYYIYICLFYSNLFVNYCNPKRLYAPLSFLRSLIIYIPFFFIGFGYSYIYNEEVRCRYYPYTTVFNRTVDHHREALFSLLSNYIEPNTNEY